MDDPRDPTEPRRPLWKRIPLYVKVGAVVVLMAAGLYIDRGRVVTGCMRRVTCGVCLSVRRTDSYGLWYRGRTIVAISSTSETPTWIASTFLATEHNHEWGYEFRNYSRFGAMDVVCTLGLEYPNNDLAYSLERDVPFRREVLARIADGRAAKSEIVELLQRGDPADSLSFPALQKSPLDQFDKRLAALRAERSPASR